MSETDMTIEEFCDMHHACEEGREWALANCESMRDAWVKLPSDYLLWVATRKGVLSDRDLRLFAVRCARSVEHLMEDCRSRNAIDVAERFANGLATTDELAAARAAAWDAAWAAAWDAAWDAAGAAAWDAAGAAARAAAGDEQAKYLRSLLPSFVCSTILAGA